MKIFFLCITISAVTITQSQTFQWAVADTNYKVLAGSCVVNDKVGNAYVAGYRLNPSGNCLDSKGSLLSKYRANGNLVWNVIAVGEELRMTIDQSQNILVAGRDSGISFIKKYDTTGSLVKKINLTVAGYLHVQGIGCDAQNNYYINGAFNGSLMIGPTPIKSTNPNSSSHNFFLIKFNSNDVFQWAKTSDKGDIGAKGCLFVDSIGNSYSGGHYLGTMAFGSSSITATGYNGYIFKITPAGALSWINNVGQSGIDEEVTSVVVSKKQEVYFTGGFVQPLSIGNTTLAGNASPNSTSIFVAKLSAGGAPVWAKEIVGCKYTSSYALALNSKEKLYIAGSFKETNSTAVPTVTFGSLVVPGTPGSYSEGFILACDSGGTALSGTVIGCGVNSDGVPRDLEVDHRGDLYVTGAIYGQIDFGGKSLTEYCSMFLAKIGEGDKVSLRKENKLADLIEVLPNPAEDFVNIKMKESISKVYIMKIIDAQGKEIFLQKFGDSNGEEIIVNTSNFSRGIYLINLTSDNDNCIRKLILR